MVVRHEQFLSPNIEEAGEAESGQRAEIVAAPDKSKLQGDLVSGLPDPLTVCVPVLPHVILVHNVFEEQFEVEYILVVRGMQAVVQSDECGMVDAVASDVSDQVFV